MRVGRAELRVGCSGWSYDDWVGPWYPSHIPAAGRLAWYAEHFDAVEVNSTHYRTPTAAAVGAWCDAVPAGFRFAVKLHRFGTHRKKLLEPEGWVPRSVEPVARLGQLAGTMLLQLPPRWTPQPERLDAALTLLRRDAPAGHRRVAVEVRDGRWLNEEVCGVLDRHRAALCLHDLLPGLLDGRATSALSQLASRGRSPSFTYLRFHGPDSAHPYHGSYDGRHLRPIAARVAELLASGVHVEAYFNNDVGAVAPHDANRFRDMVVSAA
jgi:uncharacterized protein YecE (DUF72 family)